MLLGGSDGVLSREEIALPMHIETYIYLVFRTVVN